MDSEGSRIVKLSIASLTEANAFSAKPVEKQIEWKGHTITTYVRHLSYQTALAQLNSINGADVNAARIAGSICDENGRPVFTIQDITGEVVLPRDWKEGDPLPEARGGLDHELTILLLAAIGEVQNLGKHKS